jgi:uncharacterized surface protein with fasciclin (FAS1) repeats
MTHDDFHSNRSTFNPRRHCRRRHRVRRAGDQSARVLRPTPMTKKPQDIVDTAVAAGSFKTLAAALDAAGLVATLKGPGPFTVFAPTDAAFAKLPAGTLDNLLKPENKAQLASILTYHVVPGKGDGGGCREADERQDRAGPVGEDCRDRWQGLGGRCEL